MPVTATCQYRSETNSSQHLMVRRPRRCIVLSISLSLSPHAQLVKVHAEGWTLAALTSRLCSCCQVHPPPCLQLQL